jgi:GT2 family glycosyltransferase
VAKALEKVDISTQCSDLTRVLRPVSAVLPQAGSVSAEIVAGFHKDWDSAATRSDGVTVVVCTYRRTDSLIRFLESLHRFEGSRYPVLLVDASPNADTEETLCQWIEQRGYKGPLAYVRVVAALRGLTKQRNVALRMTGTDMICFFDDDIELMSDCVTEMKRVYRESAGQVAGVAALIVNQPRHPTLLWKLRRTLLMVANLRPGTYHGSGMSVPWGYVQDSDGTVEGEWLQGGATLWNAQRARMFGFCEEFLTYSQAEDLEFSLRMAQTGKLVTATRARAAHFHASSGREHEFGLGYMAIRNRFYIHRQHFANRRALYTFWFTYAWTMDTLMLFGRMLLGQNVKKALTHIAGRLAAAYDLFTGRPDRLLPPAHPPQK